MDEDRERRLAEALRANLRRRKQQARGAANTPGAIAATAEIDPPLADPSVTAER